MTKIKFNVGDVVKVNPERGSDFLNVFWVITSINSNEAKIKQLNSNECNYLPKNAAFYFAHLYRDGECIKKQIALKNEKNAAAQQIGLNKRR